MGDDVLLPPAKRRKLVSLSEVSHVLEGQKLDCGKGETGAVLVRESKTLNCTDGDQESGTGIRIRDQSRNTPADDMLEEEDTQIQSSLPLYLSHMFGRSVGGGSQMQHQFVPAEDASSQNVCIEESSQGFSPIAMQLDSPILFSTPVSPCKPVSSTETKATSMVSVNSLSKPDTPEIQTSTTKSPASREVQSSTSAEACSIGATFSPHKRKRSLAHLKSEVKAVPKDYTCPPTCTCLVGCTEAGKLVSLFGVVLQVNPVLEVVCRTGAMAGRTVPMSSLLLGDPTKPYFKLSLWREAAMWVERIVTGDIVYFTNIRLKLWQKEIVGHTVMCSTVLNLHQPNRELPPKVREKIPPESMKTLRVWMTEQHSYLIKEISQSPLAKVVHFRTSEELVMESVVHFRAKVLAIISSKVVLLADKPGKEVHLYLIEASLWYGQLSCGVGQVWEFLYLSVSLEGTQGCYSLHTTSRSQLRNLKNDCETAREILRKFPSTETSTVVSKGHAIKDILSAKESGTFECKAAAVSLGLLIPQSPRVVLSSLIDLSELELVSQLCKAIYVGCESCCKPLKQDENGVYCLCTSCMARKPGGCPSSSFYFRPMTVTLRDESGCMEVITSHVIVPKILGVTAGSVVRSSLTEDHAQCKKVKKSIIAILEATRCSDDNMWTVSCAFSKDENSFVESVSLSLLDWKCSTFTPG